MVKATIILQMGILTLDNTGMENLGELEFTIGKMGVCIRDSSRMA